MLKKNIRTDIHTYMHAHVMIHTHKPAHTHTNTHIAFPKTLMTISERSRGAERVVVCSIASSDEGRARKLAGCTTTELKVSSESFLLRK